MGIGDLLMEVVSRNKAPPESAVGLGMGGNHLEPLFTGQAVAIGDTPGDSGGAAALVNEYATIMSDVKLRWSAGIGKYVLDKLQGAMQQRGILVTKHRRVNGITVYVDAQTLGLSDSLDDLEALAVPVSRFSEQVQKKAKSADTSVADLDQVHQPHFLVSIPPPGWQ